MNIGSCADLSGVNAKTIRYYEKIGLIPPAGRGANGYRDYSERDVDILRFIRRSRDLGFSIDEVSSLLDLWLDNSRASADVKAIAARHINEVNEKIRKLETIRDTLTGLSNCCHGDGRPDCPILNDLAGADGE